MAKNIKLMCVGLLILFVGLALAYEEEWAKHIKNYKLKFKNDEEYQQRKENFKKTNDMIEAHNKQKGITFRLGHTRFSHMTDEEKEKYLGGEISESDPMESNIVKPPPESLQAEIRASLPSTVDWRNDTCMQPIKSQGSCGSCWVFAGVSALEFANCVKTGKPVALSEQQMVDCTGGDGCKGGDPADVWLHAATVGGADSSSSYPYISGSTKTANPTCNFNASNVAATVSTSNPVTYLAEGDVTGYMAVLASKNILTVGIVVPNGFYYFTDGVFDGPCEGSVGHAVSIVGYGTSVKYGIDYWIIRNSWGKGWGEDGYMKFKRGVNLCKMESNGRATAVTTGDVPPGVPYNFVWKNSSDGLSKNSNCSYYGDTIVTISASHEDCGMYCASTPSCDLFSWWGGHCLMKSKSANQIITLAKSANWPSNCGQVINRPTFNFKSGSNGMAMVATNCGYTGVNRQELQWQNSDEEDCGAVCALNSSCAYFAYSGYTCSMYSVENQSIALTPTPYPSTYYKSCGYIISRDSPVPQWQSGSNGNVMWASNCGYIGTDPADFGVKGNPSVYSWMTNEVDCGSRCAATPTCSQFTWSKNYCYLMSLVKPVVYYSSTGSCGYVVSRPNFDFTVGSNGLAMYAKNCGYTKDNIQTLSSQRSDEADCGAVCAQTSTCAYFAFSGGNCNMYTKANQSSTVVPLPYYTILFSSCGYVTGKPTPVPDWKNVADNGPSNGQVMAAFNCSYIGANSNRNTPLTESACRMACISSSSCNQFRWANGSCWQMSLTNPVTYYSVSGSCGSVVSRQIYNFTSGSNGLAMYSKKCGYTSDNRQELQWQNGDEADCGAICALNSSCSYFAYRGFTCYMYSIANRSLALTPSPYTSSYYSSCGYLTGQKTLAPEWQQVWSGSKGQIMWAPNCGYIGTDPTDIGIQNNWNYYWRKPTDEDCRNTCINTPTCSYYKFSSVGSSNYCYTMPIVKPVVYYSATGSCGYVVKRN